MTKFYLIVYQFKVRQFPGGPQEAINKVVSLLNHEDWEKHIEGLEILNSLAQNNAEVKNWINVKLNVDKRI